MVESLPPLLSAGLRFALAGVVLALALLAWRGGRGLWPGLRRVANAALVGSLLLLGGNGLVVLGERTVASGVAALLVAAVPLWVVLLRTAGGDRPSPVTLLGVAVGLAGLGVLLLPGAGGHTDLGGALTVAGASLCWATGSYLAGRLAIPADPIVATVWEMLLGGLACLLAALVHGERLGELAAATSRSWWALGYLLVFGSLLAFTSYVWVLGHAPLSMVSTYAYVNPVVAVVLGALILAEPVTAAVLLGGATVVAGVVLVVTTETRARRSARGPAEVAK